MEVALSIVALASAVLAVTALCRRFRLPAPLVLIAAGIAGSFLPFVPELQLQPEVVLIGFLPPLLYAAALQTSLVDFNANRRPILLLSVGLILFTTAGVAAVVHWLLPGVGWPAALAIGAVVAPPDAVAATAIARHLGLPRKLVTILEGESLLNDATALVSLRTAIAALSGTVAVLDVALDFLLAAAGGVVTGLAVFAVVGWLRKRVTDPLFDTALSLITPFAAYLAAESVHASGVISVVIAGLLLGHQAPALQTATSRIAERTNWRTVAFMLEHTVFLLIGLQGRWIIEDVRASEVPIGRIVVVCLATLAAVVVLRMVWVFPARYLLVRPGADPATGRPPPASYTFILGWAGMRGVVTLAGAFIIPPGAPHREILLLIAFTVVAGTLFVQGLTLPWIARRLRVPAPDPREDALARAALLEQAGQAGLARLAEIEQDDEYGVGTLIRQRVEERSFAAWERLGADSDRVTPSEAYANTRLQMIEAERAEVLRVRSTGTVVADVVADVLGMLDVEESMIDRAGRSRSRRQETGVTVSSSAQLCQHLSEASPGVEATQTEGCEECLRDGTQWVHLRTCLQCGHVGCCDSSPQRHALGHYNHTQHPVIRSAEPGEHWRWCFVHRITG